MRVVYLAHPYSGDLARNVAKLSKVAREVVERRWLPIAPALYLPAFISEATERRRALRLCLALVALCDELHVYGEPTEGMLLEIAEAHRLGIPVVDGVTGQPVPNKRTAPDGASRAVVKR